MKIATLLALCLTGCVSVSDVVPAGGDSFMIESSAHGTSVMGDDRIRALKVATDYCAKIGKRLEVERDDTSRGWNTTSATLVFRCL